MNTVSVANGIIIEVGILLHRRTTGSRTPGPFFASFCQVNSIVELNGLNENRTP